MSDRPKANLRWSMGRLRLEESSSCEKRVAKKRVFDNIAWWFEGIDLRFALT